MMAEVALINKYLSKALYKHDFLILTYSVHFTLSKSRKIKSYAVIRCGHMVSEVYGKIKIQKVLESSLGMLYYFCLFRYLSQ